MLDEGHELVTQRLKIMKKIVQRLWCFHEEIIFKMSYLLMKVHVGLM